ncbi:hypothetical protein AX15_007563 [Amanita polypyramis BW_CC]|nr:hypothetical protein AX15_007563 [Amanita polypyramis BW_CC]
MLGLALARRSFSAVRSVLPTASAVPRLSVRYNSTGTEQDVVSGQEVEKPAVVQSKLTDTLKDNGLVLAPSQLPLPNTPDVSQGPFREETYAASYVPGRGIHLPFLHPRTHSIPVAAIHFRSYNTELLELYTHFVSHAATALGIPISRVVGLPTQRSLWTVPRSPFVHKKSQENFERKVHKRLIKAWDADQEVVDRWVRFVKKHAIGGVGMRIVKWERAPLSVGRKRMEDVAGQLRGSNGGETRGARVVEAEIKQLGERIIYQSA